MTAVADNGSIAVAYAAWCALGLLAAALIGGWALASGVFVGVLVATSGAMASVGFVRWARAQS